MHFARSLVAFLCAALLLVAASQASAQGRRMALVIGNNAYPNLDNRSQLLTAVNDADAVARALGDMGFETPTVVHNATRAQFIEALYDFAAKLTKDDAAVFYFAGHGVNFGANLYLPSDIPKARNNTKAEEARLASSAISEKEIIQTIAASGARITFAIFDACRDNPLNVEGDLSRSLGDSRGLAVEMSQAKGFAVLYSASYGQRALDRLSTDTATQGLNSVFTRLLVEELAVAGQGIRALADKLKVRVPALAVQENGHLQRPAYYDEMVGEFVLSSRPAQIALVEPQQEAGKPAVEATPAEAVSPLDPVSFLSEFEMGGQPVKEMVTDLRYDPQANVLRYSIAGDRFTNAWDNKRLHQFAASATVPVDRLARIDLTDSDKGFAIACSDGSECIDYQISLNVCLGPEDSCRLDRRQLIFRATDPADVSRLRQHLEAASKNATALTNASPEPASPAPGKQPEQLSMIPDGNRQVGPPPGQTVNPAPGALASVVWVGRIADEAFREEWQLVSRDEASRDVVVNYTKRNIDTKRVEAASIDTIPMNSIEPFNGSAIEFSCVPGKHIVRRIQKCPGFSCGHTEEELCHYAIPLSVGSVSNEQIRASWIGLVGERR